MKKFIIILLALPHLVFAGISCNQIGDAVFCSDGTIYNQIGDTTFGSDGTICNTIGDTVFCN